MVCTYIYAIFLAINLTKHSDISCSNYILRGNTTHQLKRPYLEAISTICGYILNTITVKK